MSDRFICEVCGKPKLDLQKTNSKIINKEMLSCASCIENKYEPRHIIIIAYHTNEKMRAKARPYIQNRRYVGEPILLEEVV